MVLKIVINCFVFLLLSSTGVAQDKYLYYNPNIDSIVQHDDITYYQIDNNLFDITRYAQVDTITANQFNNLKISTVKELWEEGKEERNRIFKNIEEGDPIPIIDTYNLIFKNIYVLEEISNCKFKKVRVWWVDY